MFQDSWDRTMFWFSSLLSTTLWLNFPQGQIKALLILINVWEVRTSVSRDSKRKVPFLSDLRFSLHVFNRSQFTVVLWNIALFICAKHKLASFCSVVQGPPRKKLMFRWQLGLLHNLWIMLGFSGALPDVWPLMQRYTTTDACLFCAD